jgi:hypothetical protein
MLQITEMNQVTGLKQDVHIHTEAERKRQKRRVKTLTYLLPYLASLVAAGYGQKNSHIPHIVQNAIEAKFVDYPPLNRMHLCTV